jgi:glycosyltransferase involved in cell wall biosynthesis
MNVLIDATGITKNKAGVGVYAKNLLDELVRRRDGIHFFILAQDDDPDLDYGRLPHVTMLRVPARIFRKLPLRVMLEQIGLPLLLVKYRIDVVHSLHYLFPLVRFGTKQVVTIHDMTFFSMPEVHLRFKTFYFRFFIRAAVRTADSLIFVSRSAQQDCASFLGSPRGKASVIHHGKSEAFRPDPEPHAVREVLEKYGLRSEFILYIGTIEPRKNLTRLVIAFEPIANKYPQMNLVIAGMKGWMYDELFKTVTCLKLTSRVIFPGFIAEEDKAVLLSAAWVFAYPSLYEGFGIPVLEAMACGTPTLTSNVSSIPEVVGSAALMVDPKSTEQISAGLDQLISSAAVRQELRDASIQQASQFTWQRAAELTSQVYRHTFASRS